MGDTLNFVNGFLVGYVFNFWGIGILTFLTIILVNVNWRIFSALAYGLLVYGLWNVFNLGQYDINPFLAIAGYIGTGIVWSLWKYKKFVRAEVEEYNEDNKSNGTVSSEYAKADIQRLKERLSIGRNVDSIVYHIALLPISFIESIVGDLIDLLKDIVTVYLRRVYDWVAESEFSKIQPRKIDGIETK